MLKNSIFAVLLAGVVFFLAALMGWVNINGASRQPAAEQPPVAAKRSQSVARADKDCAPQAQTAASKFIDGYIEFLNGMDAHTNRLTRDQWVERNKIATANFKSSYREAANLDVDPILVAQDWPESGFVVDSCDASGYVNLLRKDGYKDGDWAGYKVVVKVVKTNSGWRVDGAGLINILDDKRPHNE